MRRRRQILSAPPPSSNQLLLFVAGRSYESTMLTSSIAYGRSYALTRSAPTAPVLQSSRDSQSLGDARYDHRIRLRHNYCRVASNVNLIVDTSVHSDNPDVERVHVGGSDENDELRPTVDKHDRVNLPSNLKNAVKEFTHCAANCWKMRCPVADCPFVHTTASLAPRILRQLARGNIDRNRCTDARRKGKQHIKFAANDEPSHRTYRLWEADTPTGSIIAAIRQRDNVTQCHSCQGCVGLVQGCHADDHRRVIGAGKGPMRVSRTGEQPLLAI